MRNVSKHQNMSQMNGPNRAQQMNGPNKAQQMNGPNRAQQMNGPNRAKMNPLEWAQMGPGPGPK